MIVNNATLVTGWDSKPIVEAALLAIEDKTIVDFGPVGKLIDRYDDPQVLEAGGRVVLPGLINPHVHPCRSLAMALPLPNARTAQELNEAHWWRYEDALEPEEVQLSAMVGLMDAVRFGVTTLGVYHSSQGAIEGSLDILARCFAEVGIRGSIAYAVTERSGLEGMRAGITENERFHKQLERRPTEVMQGLFGLDASHRLDDATLKAVVKAARKHSSAFHLPLAEERQELDTSWSRFGKNPVSRLAAAGVLSRRTVAAHGTHLAAADDETLKSDGLRLVHCPQSDVLQGAGSGDLLRWISSGVAVGLGSGGAGMGLAEELRYLVLRQRSKGLSVADAIRLGTQPALQGNAEWASSHFGAPIGRIKPGARADLVVFDYRPTTPIGEKTIPEHLFWQVLRSPVHSVIANGRLLYKDRVFVSLDEQRIRARAREAAKNIWERI